MDEQIPLLPDEAFDVSAPFPPATVPTGLEALKRYEDRVVGVVLLCLVSAKGALSPKMIALALQAKQDAVQEAIGRLVSVSFARWTKEGHLVGLGQTERQTLQQRAEQVLRAMKARKAYRYKPLRKAAAPLSPPQLTLVLAYLIAKGEVATDGSRYWRVAPPVETPPAPSSGERTASAPQKRGGRRKRSNPAGLREAMVSALRSKGPQSCLALATQLDANATKIKEHADELTGAGTAFLENDILRLTKPGETKADNLLWRTLYVLDRDGHLTPALLLRRVGTRLARRAIVDGTKAGLIAAKSHDLHITAQGERHLAEHPSPFPAPAPVRPRARSFTHRETREWRQRLEQFFSDQPDQVFHTSALHAVFFPTFKRATEHYLNTICYEMVVDGVLRKVGASTYAKAQGEPPSSSAEAEPPKATPSPDSAHAPSPATPPPFAETPPAPSAVPPSSTTESPPMTSAYGSSPTAKKPPPPDFVAPPGKEPFYERLWLVASEMSPGLWRNRLCWMVKPMLEAVNFDVAAVEAYLREATPRLAKANPQVKYPLTLACEERHWRPALTPKTEASSTESFAEPPAPAASATVPSVPPSHAPSSSAEAAPSPAAGPHATATPTDMISFQEACSALKRFSFPASEEVIRWFSVLCQRPAEERQREALPKKLFPKLYSHLDTHFTPETLALAFEVRDLIMLSGPANPLHVRNAFGVKHEADAEALLTRCKEAGVFVTTAQGKLKALDEHDTFSFA